MAASRKYNRFKGLTNRREPDPRPNTVSDPFNHTPKPIGFRERVRRRLLDLDARIDFGVYQCRALGPRALRALHRVHGPLPCRRLAALVPGRAGLGGLDLGTVGADRDARARDPGLPRDLRRGLAEDEPSSRSPSSTATATRSARAASSHNDSIPLDEIPDHLIKAVLATEDRRFYEHFGIDIPPARSARC